jgi:hypothetical protein
MLALSSAVGYINEPFNPFHQPGICVARFPTWFQYVHARNEHLFHAPLADTLRFRYHFAAQLKRTKSKEDLQQLLRDARSFTRSRLLGARPLVKDPIAAFSASWLATTFGMATIVVVRHPAAFVASLKRLDWWPPFNDLRAQTALVRDLLGPFERDIVWMAAGGGDLVDHGGLMWLMMYSTLVSFHSRHPSWIFVRHEDLVRDPVRGFAGLFRHVDLRYTRRIARAVEWHSTGPTYDASEPSPYEVRRDSRRTVHRWHSELTPDETRRLRDRVQELSQRFYSDSEWER